MASETQPTVSIKLLIDQRRNRVVTAEVGNDFVDILLYILTLPLGNIARLVSKHQSLQPGCLNNLYKSVENLSLNSFRTDACKPMLLYPRSIHEDKPRNLKLPRDITEPTKYFICGNLGCSRKPGGLLSYYQTSRCTCGKLMDREIKVVKGESEGVLDRVESMFFITDDLRVMQGLPGHLINFLYDLGIKDVNHIAVKVVEIGSQEMSDILSHSFVSKTTLTDVFLRKPGILRRTLMLDEQTVHVTRKNVTIENAGKTSVNLILRKSDRKILYAEASENFVDLLFSFLTIPLEFVLSLLEGGGGNLTVGSMSNLFSDLDTISSTKQKNPQNVVLPPFYSCPIEFANICSQDPPVYYCYSESSEISNYYLTSAPKLRLYGRETSVLLKLLDSKSPEVNTTNSTGYVKKMLLFVVTGDLEVKPLSSVSSISLLMELGVRPDDIEQQVINIGEAEALALLRACMCSSSPLSVLLDFFPKKPKKEPL